MINIKEIDKILKKKYLPNQLWYSEPNFGSYYTSEEINSLTKLIKNCYCTKALDQGLLKLKYLKEIFKILQGKKFYRSK